MYNRPMWPQCWDLQGPRGLEQRDLRNLNLRDLKKGPNGGVSPPPKKNLAGSFGKKKKVINAAMFMSLSLFRTTVSRPEVIVQFRVCNKCNTELVTGDYVVLFYSS
jgi:hypothetical protein